MSPLSVPVLGGAALVSSPALWRALVEGTAPTQVALAWYLVSVLAVWLGLSVVSAMVGPPPQPEAAAVAATDDGPAGE